MRLLLDTCILSELRSDNTSLKSAIQQFDSKDLFISVITLGEISKGIALLPTSKKKTELTHWAIMIENNYQGNILNINSEIVHIWGELTANAQRRGKIIPAADGLIAATALAHGLHIMTPNIADFEATGSLLFNF